MGGGPALGLDGPTAWPRGGVRARGWSKTLRGQPAAAQAAPAPLSWARGEGAARQRTRGGGRTTTTHEPSACPCSLRELRVDTVGPCAAVLPLFCVSGSLERGAPRGPGCVPFCVSLCVALPVLCCPRCVVLGRSGVLGSVRRAQQQRRDARALLNRLAHTLRYDGQLRRRRPLAPCFLAVALLSRPQCVDALGAPPLTQHRRGGAGRVPPPPWCSAARLPIDDAARACRSPTPRAHV